MPEWAKKHTKNKTYSKKMKTPMRKTMVAVGVAFLTAGCASIVSKSEWPITFASNPSGAEIVITDKDGREIHRGTTPTTLTLRASAGYFSPARYDVEVKLAGYNTGRGSVSANLNGWYVGNLLFGGLIGFLVVDPLTGAMFRLPEQYTINLTKSVALNPDERALKIVSISEVPSELRSKLIRIN
ncbi:MAG: hypothetical protein N3I86_03190 [Verrucomicrobiae bacterium]|nr:hypothetical protein [Verrucomicrobiae bacterium]